MKEIWRGKTFIEKENGDKILIRALEHYKKTLTKIDLEQQSMGSFGMLLGQEAKNAISKVNPILDKIKKSDPKETASLESDVPILEKALNCYHADICKIVDEMEKRYTELFDEPKKLKEDIPLVKEALEKITTS